MLIYNYQKEFLGIDNTDLTKMGFSNLAELRAEAADFADLFVKTPGYIHNFKHVHWIDFIECAESNDVASVIIHANNQNFKCNIEIKTAFLVDSPTKKAYLIYLNNLRALTQEETLEIANDIKERAVPKPAPASTTNTHTPYMQKSNKPTHQEEVVVPLDDEDATSIKIQNDLFEQDELDSIDVFDTPEPAVPDTPIELDFDDEILENTKPIAEVKPKPTQKKVQEDDFKIDLQDTNPIKNTQEEDDIAYESDYVYDPTIASQELGLPLDLIEEFMEDFITQARDFKEQLYIAYDQGDKDKLKSLSHKLKGVAANLRIEDAFEVLSTINTSDNSDEIKKNLNIFYKIVAKLSGEDIKPTTKAQPDIVKDPPPAELKTEDLIDIAEPAIDEKIELNDEIELADEKIELDDKIELTEIEESIDIDLTEDVVDDPHNEEKIDFNEENLYDDDAIELKLDEDLPELQETIPTPKSNNIDETAKIQDDFDYNKELIAKQLGIDTESFNELFDDFIVESKLTANRIADAIEQNDSDLWKRHTTKLKGMSTNMKINKLDLELDVLTSTDDINIAKEAIKTIQTSLEKISTL